MSLHTAYVCFICNCRAAFLPILTLTATAWDPTTFRYLWTVPSVLEWPTTSVTGPCAFMTIRVGLWHLAPPARAEGTAGQSSRTPRQAGVLSLAPWDLLLLQLCGVWPALKLKLPEDSPYFHLWVCLIERPTLGVNCCLTDSERQGETSFILATAA